MKINVLQVLNSLGRGGIESLVRDLCQNMDRSRINIEVAIMDGKSLDQYETFCKMGIKIHTYPRLTIKTAPAFLKWWKDFFAEHKGYYKIVDIHTFTTAALYVKYAKQSGAYVIVHSHSVIPEKAQFKSTVKRKGKIIRRFLYRQLQSDRYIDFRMACSKMAGEGVFGSKPFQILNNGIVVNNYQFDEKARKELRERNGWNESLIVGHVGNGTGAKKYEFLLEMFNELHKLKPDSRLLLIGKLETLESKLRQYAQEHNLLDSISFLGVRNDVPALMSAMDVFVFPSLYEGLGIVLIEAQAEGLPCIVSDQVPSEANISPLFHTVSLSSGSTNWAEVTINAYMKNKQSDRTKATSYLKKSGYDIVSVAKCLENLYMNIGKE